MRKANSFLSVLVLFLTPVLAFGQGFLVDDRHDVSSRMPRPIWPHPPTPRPTPRPAPPQSYKIRELTTNVNLVDQIAKVQVSQTFVNTGSVQMEVSFIFPLPYDGAVDRLTFLLDGKEYDAKLLDADEARRIYEGYIRRNQDPALLEWIGTGMFKTSVFPVPPGAERTVTLRYSQICRKTGGLTELMFPLSTAKYTSHPVEKYSLNINIQSQSPIKNVYSPTHAIEIKRPGDKNAVVSFSRTNEVPGSDFRLLYDVGSDAVGASALSYRPDVGDDGYFMLLISPEIKKQADQVAKKNVVFVVDRSGSMSGKKIEQAKLALKFVLNNLREGDLFNVVAYDSVVESFRPEMQRYNDENRQAALGFAEGLFAGGSTNIDGALHVALSQLSDDTRPNYVVFLTDGLPTVGVMNETQIVTNAKSLNKLRARVFSLGVGYDVNSRLLDKLARSCFGQSEYVRPNEDIEDRVSKLYNRIGAPTLTNVTIKLDVEGASIEQGPVVNRVYPRDAYDLFAGDQLVVVGRYKKSGAGKVTIEGTVDQQKQTFHFPAQLVEKSNDESMAFIEKLWAMRRVGEIIDEVDLHGKNKELIDELVALSKKHGILTPYTSFLADETIPFRNLAETNRRADVALDALSAAPSGAGGFSQRAEKGNLQRAAQSQSSGGGGLGANFSKYKSADSDKEVVVQTIQNVGRKTFFLRKNRWTDSSLTEEQEKKTQKVQRFSQDYFDLITKHGKDAAKYLALEGNVAFELGGQTYELVD